MEDMGNSKLTAIDIDFPDGTKISMKKETKAETVIVNQTETKPTQTQIEIATPVSSNETNQEDGNVVTSPMVGTFYMKPSPTSESYVEIGKAVKRGDTLCIIEAMKLMNEIESEFNGTITEILVNDGEPVEYGTPLFKIK